MVGALAIPSVAAAGEVEVARDLPSIVAVRDTKDPGGPRLIFSPAEWEAFTAGVRDGEFDVC
jgi:hypothetical protein